MSETQNQTNAQAADAQLSDAELEQVAGGAGIIDSVKEAAQTAVTTVMVATVEAVLWATGED